MLMFVIITKMTVNYKFILNNLQNLLIMIIIAIIIIVK